MRILFFACLYLVFPLGEQASAQGLATIGGTVTDMAKQELAGTTIELHRYQDNSFKMIVLSDKKGGFIFSNLSNGGYTIKISYNGLKPFISSLLVLDTFHKMIVLPVIVLQPASGTQLKTVTVSTKKPLIEQKIDRVIVNIDVMLSAAGSNALEVLAKSPGVSINSNDDISLNGKGNVLVLIDERATYMSAQSLAAYLRSLPAGMLEKLELIGNPPARYDANGNAIINIVLKKSQATGFNGTVNVGYNQGVYARNNDAINSNYRLAKINLFANASFSRDKNFSDQSFNRYFYNDDGTFKNQISQNSLFRYQSNGWNGRVGLDYFASGKTILGFILTGSSRPRTDLLTYVNNRYDQNMLRDSMAQGFTSGKYGIQNFGVNLNLQHKFNNTGEVLAINADMLNYNNTGNQLSPVDIYLPTGTLANHQQHIFSLPSNVHIYAAKADYILPLHGKAQIDAGVKSSYVVAENQSNWYTQASDSIIQDYGKSNHFRYTENINSLYLSAKKDWIHWSVQAGMRMENTAAAGRQFSNAMNADSIFYKHYTNLFPSLFLLYRLDSTGSNSLALSISRRISRPSYQQLNPFAFFRDISTYTAGNAALVPSFSQFAELKYSHKGQFGVTLSYGGGNNGINPLTEAKGDVFITRPVNYIDVRLVGVIPYVSLQPTNWWSFNFQAILLWQHIEGVAPGISIDQHTGTHEIEGSSQFHLNKKWSTELTLFFPGAQTYGQNHNDAVYNVGAGVQKKILNGEGNLRCNINNIFNSLAMHSQILSINGVRAFNNRLADDRRISLSFTYNFGKAANARKRNDTSSAEDEKGRTN